MNKVGLEIEVPFRFYFPEVYAKHFGNGQMFLAMSKSEREDLIRDTELVEPVVKERIARALEQFGLERGLDRYCEFILNPEEDYTKHLPIISGLVEANVVPLDMPLSVHFTIGNIDRDKAFAILFFLELKYNTANRMLEGFNDLPHLTAWNRKGKCGVMKKKKEELKYEDSAYELRTIKVSMRELPNVLKDLDRHLNKESIVKDAKKWLKEIGLPWKAWNKAEFEKFAGCLNYLNKYHSV